MQARAPCRPVTPCSARYEKNRSCLFGGARTERGDSPRRDSCVGQALRNNGVQVEAPDAARANVPNVLTNCDKISCTDFVVARADVRADVGEQLVGARSLLARASSSGRPRRQRRERPSPAGVHDGTRQVRARPGRPGRSPRSTAAAGLRGRPVMQRIRRRTRGRSAPDANARDPHVVRDRRPHVASPCTCSAASSRSRACPSPRASEQRACGSRPPLQGRRPHARQD